jgi:hypothetical protein
MAVILPDIAKVEAAIVEITNTVRTQASLGPVTVSPQLTQAARDYAALLARTGKFSHDADGTLTDRTGRAGYQHCLIAENLASHRDSRGFESRALAKSAMEGWLNSPGHRQNLMTGDVTEIGVAVAKTPDKDPQYIAVQVLGRPQSAMVTFQVSNSSTTPVSTAFQGKSREIAPHMSVTMQACSGGPLAIRAGGSKAAESRFEVANGASYVVVSGGEGGKVRVEIKTRQTVK